jgi:hypothetical protein
MPRWYIFLPIVVLNWLQNGICRDSMNYQDLLAFLFRSPFKEVHHESGRGKPDKGHAEPESAVIAG